MWPRFNFSGLTKHLRSTGRFRRWPYAEVRRSSSPAPHCNIFAILLFPGGFTAMFFLRLSASKLGTVKFSHKEKPPPTPLSWSTGGISTRALDDVTFVTRPRTDFYFKALILTDRQSAVADRGRHDNDNNGLHALGSVPRCRHWRTWGMPICSVGAERPEPN